MRAGAYRSTRSVRDEISPENSITNGLVHPMVQPFAYSVFPTTFGAPFVARPWMTHSGYNSAPIWVGRPAVTLVQQPLTAPWAYS